MPTSAPAAPVLAGPCWAPGLQKSPRPCWGPPNYQEGGGGPWGQPGSGCPQPSALLSPSPPEARPLTPPLPLPGHCPQDAGLCEPPTGLLGTSSVHLIPSLGLQQDRPWPPPQLRAIGFNCILGRGCHNSNQSDTPSRLWSTGQDARVQESLAADLLLCQRLFNQLSAAQPRGPLSPSRRSGPRTPCSPTACTPADPAAHVPIPQGTQAC